MGRSRRNRGKRPGLQGPETPQGLTRPPGAEPPPGLPAPGARSPQPPVGTDDPDLIETISDALAHRRQLMATYADEVGVMDHVFYPLALGTRDGGYRVWAYQFAGGSGVGWRCFVVAKLRNLTAKQGDWLVPEGDPGPAQCMDEVLRQVG